MIDRLDRDSSTPLWAQLESLLRQRLESREFDDRFPTEAQLTREYEVSRHTVREAIRHLNRSGVLDRQRGRGTVVNRAESADEQRQLTRDYFDALAAGIDPNLSAAA